MAPDGMMTCYTQSRQCNYHNGTDDTCNCDTTYEGNRNYGTYTSSTVVAKQIISIQPRKVIHPVIRSFAKPVTFNAKIVASKYLMSILKGHM